MKLSAQQALVAFGIALGGAYAEAPAVDEAISRAYDAFATGLTASGIAPHRISWRTAAARACAQTVGSDPDANAALWVAQSLYIHLLGHPSAVDRLLIEPAVVIAALEEHWPANLDRAAVAERIAFACPEAADRLLSAELRMKLN